MKTARPLTERNTGRLKGYLLGIIAAASYGTNPLFALPLYQAGMSPDGVLFLRYMMALPVLALMIVLRGQTFRITWRQCLILVIMGMLVAVSSLTLFCSYNYMDVGIASTILFVYPIMDAVYIVAVNKTSLVRVATLTITFYVLLFGVSLFAVRLQMAGEPLIPHLPDWRLWLCLGGLAIFPTAISFACTNGAIQTIGSTPTAILGAFEPVTAVIIGIAVFGETLTLRSLTGLVLIVMAVILVIVGPGIHKPLVRVRRLFPRRRR